MSTNLDTFTYYDADGQPSEHPRPRCECGGIFDPHESKDAAVCRNCGKETTGEAHARDMRKIVAETKNQSGLA